MNSIGITEEHGELAEVALAIASKSALADGDVREHYEGLARGDIPRSWTEIVENGLHVIHLSDEYGGGGATLTEVAIVIEQFSKRLYAGPLLSTAITVAILDRFANGKAPEKLVAALSDIAEGTPAATVVDTVFSAHQQDKQLVLNGTAAAVVGAQSAGIFCVRVRQKGVDGDQWALLRREQTGVDVVTDESFDLTHPMASVTLNGVTIEPSDLLMGVDEAKAMRIWFGLVAADATGIAAETKDRAVEHVKMRTQFRRRLADFQAVQHRLAHMHVREEQTRAISWDACSALDETASEDRLAGHAAAVLAANAAKLNAYDYVLSLGAIGFTWEHDAHLLWRRAVQHMALTGPLAVREKELGSFAMSAERTISIIDASDRSELRAEVREALANAGDPSEGVIPGSAWAPRRDSAWQRALAEQQLVSPQLAAPYGRDADVTDQAVILDEFLAAGIRPPSLVIGEWVIPTIVEHGTPAQQERFIPPTLASDIMWCQLFSEPGAGSDLGSISTRAERVEGGWLVNGQKIWNTLAHESDWGALLLRVDPDSTGSRGLGFFLVDMRAQGVLVRPIKQAVGIAEFCEVFLDDVFIPDDQVIGEPGDGWTIATTTLANERLRMGEALGHGSTKRFKQLITRSDEGVREVALPAFGRAFAREAALEAMQARGALKRMRGIDAASETSVLKLANILAQQLGADELVSLNGPDGAAETVATPHASYGDLIDYIGLPAVVFGGGTPDIQLTVIARKVLGL